MFNFQIDDLTLQTIAISLCTFVVLFTIVNVLNAIVNWVYNSKIRKDHPLQLVYFDYKRDVQGLLKSNHNMPVELDLLHQPPFAPYIAYCVIQGIDSNKCANFIADKIKNSTLIG